jgi:protein HOOK3
MSRISVSGDQGVGEVSMTEYVFLLFVVKKDVDALLRDDHYYQIQSERSQILAEKDTLNQVYQALLEEHRALQTNFGDMVSEKDDALSRLRDVQRHVDSQRNEKADIMMRAEIDRLRTEL